MMSAKTDSLGNMEGWMEECGGVEKSCGAWLLPATMAYDSLEDDLGGCCCCTDDDGGGGEKARKSMVELMRMGLSS